MIRGSVFSAILHGLLLAALFYGLPHIVRFIKDDQPLPEIQLAVLTPELTEAIERVTAPQPNQQAAETRNRLTADAVNTEKPQDERTILQSASSSSVLAKPEEKADEQAPSTAQPIPPEKTPDDEKAPLPSSQQARQSQPQANEIQSADTQKPIDEVRPLAADSETPSPPRTQNDRASAPNTQQSDQREAAKATPAQQAAAQADARQISVPAEPEKPAGQASVEQGPAQPAAQKTTEAISKPQVAERAQSRQAVEQKDAQRALEPVDAPQDRKGEVQAGRPTTARAEQSASTPAQTSPPETPASGAAQLAQGDGAAKAIQPLVAALPRLDETIGEILTAQTRDNAAAVAAAESTPASQQAIRRMESAAEQGYAHAQFSLAEIYLTGDGRPRDVERGKAYLQRAAVNGNVPAQLLLAALAVEGSVVPRDLAEAHAWLSAASERGNKQARETLQRIEQQMNAREELRARQRRAQLRQVFILSNPLPENVVKQPPKEEQLRVATTLGDVEAVYVSLTGGADADKPDDDGRTPIIEAAWRGYGKIVNALLDQGANLKNVDGSGKTALMWAAINGHAAVAEQLITADLPIDAQDGEGLTALMRAAWNGHADVVRLLLQKRANVRLRDRSGKAALDYANMSRNPETIRLVLTASRN